MSDDIIKRLREAIAEHPLCYAADIAALLDRLDKAERECERLRMELAHEEQRVADMMADVNRVGHENEALREDAERYRWLRRKFAIIPTARSASAFVPVNLPQPTHIAPDAAVELDAAIDAARAAEQPEGGE